MQCQLWNIPRSARLLKLSSFSHFQPNLELRSNYNSYSWLLFLVVIGISGNNRTVCGGKARINYSLVCGFIVRGGLLIPPRAEEEARESENKRGEIWSSFGLTANTLRLALISLRISCLPKVYRGTEAGWSISLYFTWCWVRRKEWDHGFGDWVGGRLCVCRVAGKASRFSPPALCWTHAHWVSGFGSYFHKESPCLQLLTIAFSLSLNCNLHTRLPSISLLWEGGRMDSLTTNCERTFDTALGCLSQLFLVFHSLDWIHDIILSFEQSPDNSHQQAGCKSWGASQKSARSC